MPRRQSAEAVKIRRLKKADFEVDFFFMNDEVELFPSPVRSRDGSGDPTCDRGIVSNNYFHFCVNSGIWFRSRITAGARNLTSWIALLQIR